MSKRLGSPGRFFCRVGNPATANEACSSRSLSSGARHNQTVVARLDRAIQYAATPRLSQTSLEYWIARSSSAKTRFALLRAMTPVFARTVHFTRRAT
jgi:hypothetical protein